MRYGGGRVWTRQAGGPASGDLAAMAVVRSDIVSFNLWVVAANALSLLLDVARWLRGWVTSSGEAGEGCGERRLYALFVCGQVHRPHLGLVC